MLRASEHPRLCGPVLTIQTASRSASPLLLSSDPAELYFPFFFFRFFYDHSFVDSIITLIFIPVLAIIIVICRAFLTRILTSLAYLCPLASSSCFCPVALQPSKCVMPGKRSASSRAGICQDRQPGNPSPKTKRSYAPIHLG